MPEALLTEATFLGYKQRPHHAWRAGEVVCLRKREAHVFSLEAEGPTCGEAGTSRTLVLSSVHLLHHIPKVKGRANSLNTLGLGVVATSNKDCMSWNDFP